MMILGFLAVASFSLMALAQQAADAVVEPSLKAPRERLLEWRSAQGRPYWYRLPKAIDASRPPDLVLMLHGTGTNHGWSFWNYPILGDFRRRDIVVSPDGLTSGQGGTFNFVQGPKDGEQIAGLIAEFRRRFPIGRVYLYGHSQGAFFCYWFAGEHPELIDGIVAHAGNVLDVRHGRLAREKVAIGILHGRADAVVPVDCAIRSERIYREQGYQKVRLEIVEGLTEQSGHWPLPVQVAAMFDWLDQVSVQSAVQAVQAAIREWSREAPDYGVVGEQIAKARKLLAKANAVDKPDVAAAIEVLQAFLDKVVLVQSQALLADADVAAGKAGSGAWVEEFLVTDRAFGGHAEWRRAMAKVRERKSRHDKSIEKALPGLDTSGRGALAAVLRVCEEAFLGERWAELQARLHAASIAAGATAVDVAARAESLARERAELAAAGTAAMRARLSPLREETKPALPTRFLPD